MSISFCIPTYNRDKLLKQTLDSVFLQLDQNRDQVVVSDNCSSDNTKNLIQAYQEKYQCLTYHRWDCFVEAGQNLLKSVDLAKNEFCWLLTDDDIIEPGGVQKVKEKLKTYPTLSGISVGIKGYDFHLKNEKKIRFQHKLKTFQLFQTKEDCLKHLGAWLGFWSAQIVRKSYWDEALSNPKYLNYLGYHHLYLLAQVIQKHPSWAFLPDPIVGYRSDNETFSKEHGLIKRFAIDAMTYQAIYSELFGKTSKITKKICRDVLKYYLFWQLVSAKCQTTKTKTFLKIFRCIFPRFYNQRFFWTHFMTLLILPRFFVLAIRKMYRLFFKQIKLDR